jgi:alkylhydroperoxidase family enzyme
MYLRDVENKPAEEGPYAQAVAAIRASGAPVPQILHLFAYKPEATVHFERFSQAVMRGPSPLSPGLRELIAAFTSARNHCPF